MDAQWMHTHVFPLVRRVASVRVERGSVARGKQSVVAKLAVTVEEQSANGPTWSSTRRLFLKRYVKSELPARAARNWARDLASYRSEARFYAHVHALLEPHVPLIRPLAVLARHDRAGLETGDAYLVLLDNVVDDDGGKRSLDAADALSRRDTEHALLFLAKMHAAGLTSPPLMAKVRSHLWASGAWWSLEKRGHDELMNAPRVWAGVYTHFEAIFAEQGVAMTEQLQRLGERMVQHAPYISEQLFGAPSDAFAASKTIVHGDFKTANLFFDAETREVTAFDWQWAGVGLGALDVANLLNTSVGIDALQHEHELLRFYFDAFAKELRTRGDTEGGARCYSFDAFERHYALATLEYARVLLSNFWDGMTPRSCMRDAGKTNWGLGYRSVPHVVRLVRKLDDGLHAFALEAASKH